MKEKLLSVFLISVISFVAFEATLWLMPLINTSFSQKVSQYANYAWPYSSEGWAFRSIKGNTDNKVLNESPLYQHHPIRGWAFKPNVQLWFDGYAWTTNALGQRSLHTPNPNTTKPKIMILGDSQTAGDEVDDSHAWPHLLHEQLPSHEIINYSVSGYSLSQMILAAIEHYPKWQPDYIVLAIIGDDLYRSGLSFRTARMQEPKDLLNHQVKPIPTQDNRDVKQNYFSSLEYGLRHLKSVSFVRALVDRMGYSQNSQLAHQVNLTMLEQLLDQIDQDKTKIILSYLPYPYELLGQATQTELPRFQELCHTLQSESFQCLQVGDYMQNLSEYRQGGGHYHRRGNLTAAYAVQQSIMALEQAPSPPTTG